jgi:hypothetical protein
MMSIYLLAAIVSAHAEEDFDAGMNINLFRQLSRVSRLCAPWAQNP